MFSKTKRALAALSTAALVVVGLVAAQPASAEVNIPKSAWPACDDFMVDFCIESVKVQPLGTKTALELSYVRSAAATPAAPAADAASDSASVSPAPEVPRFAGANTAGMWTHENWGQYNLNSKGYDGLHLDLKGANAFSNDIFFTVFPAMVKDAGGTALALRGETNRFAIDLDENLKITVTARIGAMRTGVSIGIANNLSTETTQGTEDNPGKLVMSGTPIPVPQITNTRQCEGETGVASAVVKTMQGYLVQESETGGFGLDGLSGRMTVASNGVSCGVSTPVWDAQSESMNWQAGAPHFADDGVTPNLGFYKAVIPANDALILWGLSEPEKAATALQVQVLTEQGGTAAVSSRRISYLRGNIIIEVTGFQFSKPKIQIKKLASFKGFAKKKATLVCTDPITKKKVTFKNAYACPKAPSKPVQTFATTAFANAKSTLTTAQQTSIRGWLNNFREANIFVCTGIHSTKATASQKLVAQKRAQAVCAYAKTRDRTLATSARVQASATASQQNKVLVTMRNEPQE
jgi:hypothetical protein